ncbi:hypothetical protein IF129_04340 [Streptomyces chumphonensis]|uniref:Uncharacterized protein n=1 Tax=Streptomyces chumphonensis TaxID=1214925 RepID=A0A927IBE6_9ACTN|nr:hypothetical protein [Streptomyces chumphonensis]MBD3930795.1 hypothetical protein [Streptomyces chumphonensis]
MRARDRVAVSALRTTLAALDNAEAVPVHDAGPHAAALQDTPVGVGSTEAARQALSERGVVEIVRSEADERLAAAARLTAPAYTERATRLRAEAAVLLGFLDGPGTAEDATARRP